MAPMSSTAHRAVAREPRAQRLVDVGKGFPQALPECDLLRLVQHAAAMEDSAVLGAECQQGHAARTEPHRPMRVPERHNARGDLSRVLLGQDRREEGQ